MRLPRWTVDAGWSNVASRSSSAALLPRSCAWAKALSGILLFESGFVGVLGPMQREAERSAAALVGKADPSTLAASLAAEGAVVKTAGIQPGLRRMTGKAICFDSQDDAIDE